MAPPCGTSSAARNIPIKMPNNRPAPKVLRTRSHPDGIAFLQGVDFERVCKANKLYCFTSKAVKFALQHGLIIAVENPLNSMFWLTSFWQEVAHLLSYFVHHACAYGSDRKKATQVASNSDAFANLTALCPGDHTHKPWGIDFSTKQFATSIETEYPTGLCKAIAHIFASILIQHDIPSPPATLQEMNEDTSSFMQVARTATQPWAKQSKLPPLVPEHKLVQTITAPASQLPQAAIRQRLSKDFTFQNVTVPIDSQLLRATPKPIKGGQDGDGLKEENTINSTGEPIVQHAYGIPFSKEEFVQEAVKAGHPKSFLRVLPSELKSALHDHFTLSPAQIATKRKQWLSAQLRKASELSREEEKLKACLSTHVRSILKDKRLLLFKSMLTEMHYEDVEIADLLVKGGNLVGPIQEGNVFPKHFRPNIHSVEQLNNNVSMYRDHVLSSAKLTGDSDLDKRLVEKSLEEVEKGWAEGPLAWSDLREPYILNRRFAIRQKGKVRCVDDYSSSGVNGTCSSGEKRCIQSMSYVEFCQSFTGGLLSTELTWT